MTTSATAGLRSIPPSDPRWRLSWGAIFAGLLITMIVQLLLTLLGAAIGLAAWDPHSGAGLGIGAGIWALVTMLIALFLGGGTAGWVSAAQTRGFSMLHGTLVWSITTLLTVWLIASGIGAITGATFRVLGNVFGATASAATQGVSAAVGNSTNGAGMSDLRSQIETLLQQTGNPALQPDSLRTQAQHITNQATQTSASNSDLADQISTMFQNTAGTVNRDDLVNVISARTGKSRAESEQIADRLIALQQSASAKLDTLKRQAGAAAEHVSNITSTALWFALIGMLLAWGAAVLGANWGSMRTRVTE